MNAFPSAEITPAYDERPRPIIGPNMASSKPLCEKVIEHVWREFAYPYMLQQERLWPAWDRIDDAWRVKGKAIDLDISATDPSVTVTNPDGKAQGIVGRDGYSAKVYPSAFHRQVRNKTDLHMSVAWDGGLPVRAKKPDTMYENPLYNPETQSVNAQNELLQQCADQLGLKERDRLVRGSWSKYGHAYVATDFRYRIVPQQVTHTLPPDPQAAIMLVQAVMAQMGGQPPQITPGQFGQQATWWTLTVDPDSMVTDFQPIRHDCVLLDQTLPATPMEGQPCPCVRSHITRFKLFGNDYEPQQNPFGWLNTRLAMSENNQQYTLSAQDEGSFRREIQKKWGLSDSGMLKPRNTIRQLWTCYPMLAIDPATGELDTGEGIECPTCRGNASIPEQEPVYEPEVDLGRPPTTRPTGASIPCPDCERVGKKFIEPERYVVQIYGLLSIGAASSATCLRIQRNPTVGDKVPLIFGAHLTEDTAGAIPLAWTEAALPATDQLATAHNQFMQAKNVGINPQWTVQQDEPCKSWDLNRPGRNIEWDAKPPEKMQSPSVDMTATLIPYMNTEEGEIQQIGGLPPVLLGQVSSGRRAATDIQTASDSANLPITVEIDSCNTQIHGKWARQHLDNIEAYADRDWILKRTGKTSFGRAKLYTQVAKDFFTQQAQLQLLQNFLPAAANIPGFKISRAAQRIFELAGFQDASEFVDDGGERKAQMDAFRIVSEFLGDGKLSAPTPFDPHEIYITIFQQATMDPEWRKRSPEFIPLLEQRLQMQIFMLQQQQQQQMMAQAQQAALMAGAQAGPQGQGNPKKPSQIPANATESRQQQAGRNAPQ